MSRADRARLGPLEEVGHRDDAAPGPGVEDPPGPGQLAEGLGHEDLGLRPGDERPAVYPESAPVEVPLADQVLDRNAGQAPSPEGREAVLRRRLDLRPQVESQGIVPAEHVRSEQPRVPRRGVGAEGASLRDGFVEEVFEGHEERSAISVSARGSIRVPAEG